uniref:Uncharacterized protein n=1 Tax=Arundo donax TaxID=35708 RepID=A0A0A9B5C9_ARUDO
MPCRTNKCCCALFFLRNPNVVLWHILQVTLLCIPLQDGQRDSNVYCMNCYFIVTKNSCTLCTSD